MFLLGKGIKCMQKATSGNLLALPESDKRGEPRDGVDLKSHSLTVVVSVIRGYG